MEHIKKVDSKKKKRSSKKKRSIRKSKQISGPIAYRKIVIPSLHKIIHIFGDRHVREVACQNKSYLLEQVVENTITKNPDIIIDVFLEVGYGSVLLKDIIRIKEADHDIRQITFETPEHFYKKAFERKNKSIRLDNSFYIDSFENYFVNSADCFLRPRQPTCAEKYPNARFHNIDFRETIHNECIELLMYIKFKYVELLPLFNGQYYQFQLWDIFANLQSLLEKVKEPKKDIANFINKMISLRIARYKEEMRQDESYKIKIDFPIAYKSDDEFLNDLAAVILEPESEPSYIIKKLYKSISHVQDQRLHIPLKTVVDKTIAHIRKTYSTLRVSLEFLEFQKNKLYSVSQKDYEDAEQNYEDALGNILDVATGMLDLYTIIRMMKSDYQNIIMYCGNYHLYNIVDVLTQIFRDIKLSFLYENNDNQCIEIPMQDGALLFTPDVYQDKPIRHVPVKKAEEKTYNPRYPSRQLVALRQLTTAFSQKRPPSRFEKAV